MSRITTSLFILLFITQQLSAAEHLPENDIFLLDLSVDFPEPINLSQHRGYNNQPAFSSDGMRVYYSRGDGEQTDIWYFDFALEQIVRLTNTPESEYSPKPAPHNNSISMVRVAMDGAQQLSLLNLDSGVFSTLAEELDKVGYYSWFSGGSAAIFLLPEPFELRLYASADEQLEVASNVGRSFHTHPITGQLLYVDKTKAPWKVMAFSPTQEKVEVASLFPNTEDFTISTSGTLWTALASKIYKRSESDTRWELVTDLRSFGITNISRLAVSPDESTLVLVNTR